MVKNPEVFFSSVLSAGAILTGFCGTFLSFRIQREANYYRQPALDFQTGKAKDIPIQLTHFTSPFLLLILATLFAVIFGFLLPLFALAGATLVFCQPELVIAGLVAALVFFVAYFLNELVHYEVLASRLREDVNEWGKEKVIVYVAILIASISAVASWMVFRAST